MGGPLQSDGWKNTTGEGLPDKRSSVISSVLHASTRGGGAAASAHQSWRRGHLLQDWGKVVSREKYGREGSLDP